MPPRIEDVCVVILAAPVGPVQREVDDRLVLSGESVGVGLDRFLGHAGFDQLDRDPHHVVPALPAVLALVDPSMRCAQVRGSPQLGSVPGGAAWPVATMPVRRV